MTTTMRLTALTPELRAAAFHFTVYSSGATASVYFGIWLAGKGINSEQIGIINALPVLAMLAMNLFVGRIADRASDWRQVIIIMSVTAGLIPIGLFFTHDFWGILLVWTLLTLPAGSIPPVIDAATLRLTQRRGSDFGFVRAWGTVGYMIIAAMAGFITASFGEASFLPLFLAMSLLRLVVSLQLPRFRAPATVPTLAETAPRAGRLREVLRPWFVLPLVAFGLLQANHSILGAFAGLVWKEHGVSEALIGPLIAISAGAEATMMFFWKRIGGRISARHMILLASVATIVRWTAMAFNPPVVVLFGLQCLHALTYAVGYFGMVHFIANWTSEEIAAQAQGFAFVLQQAATVCILLVFGTLVASLGAKAFLIAAGLGIVATVCVVVSLWLKPAKGERRP